MARVSVRGLVKNFENAVTAVDGVSFDVADGELVTLLGPSGCGKTTTLRLIAGLETPDEGEIAFGDRVVTSASTGVFVSPESRDAGMVFQSYAIWPHMTVFANVAYPLRMKRMQPQEIRARVNETLGMVGLLELQSRMATHLSGGQQQRTAIARAIVGKPSLLLLDEPLSNLDARLRAQMRAEIRDLQQSLEITAVYVTHDQAEAMVLSDRVVVLDKGKVQQLGPPQEIYNRPISRFVAEFVGFDNFIPGAIVEQRGDRFVVRIGQDGPVLQCVIREFCTIGDDVCLVVRSTNVDISRDAIPGATNTIRGVVTQALFYGDAIEYRVATDHAHLVAILTDRQAKGRNEGRILVGESVHLSVDPEWLIPVRASTPSVGPE